ncbi:MAG: manganese efflux pump [Erysipelotrichaceae bacterium]|nr:manganese efflux pump [Erysipelotrichaceae bacterium]
MALWELFVIAVGLSMDAFAVSICKGLSVSKLEKKHMLLAGLYFGGFQAGMPLIGYLLGTRFETLVTSVDHWIAFVLLGIIGFNMVKESRETAEELDASFDVKTMIGLAIATSIDALAVGITFAFLNVNIVPAVAFIGIVTFTFSAVGIRIGNVFGLKYKSSAELAGGLVLIAMGVKILLEHLGIF